MTARAWVLVALMVGCASQEPRVIEKKVMVERPVLQREPGSLWSDSSTWNSLFTDFIPRKTGDLLRVKYTDSFRELMMKRLKRDLPKAKLDAAMDEADLAVQISEVFSSGIYNVLAERMVRFEDNRVRLKVTATIREKDIKANDSVSWDELYNLTWSIEAPKT